ncbi:hypothetical protein E6H20_10370 [Candidatus Bathyarchaeota archaeon]|nr:MAG: hypothetical protein E6H20_10370 [Candidatus Bathyarchaeota archaeon]
MEERGDIEGGEGVLAGGVRGGCRALGTSLGLGREILQVVWEYGRCTGDVSSVEFNNMINEVKKRTGWKTVDEVKITGNYRGRECTALYGGKRYSFNIRFDSKGGIDAFSERVPPRA